METYTHTTIYSFYTHRVSVSRIVAAAAADVVVHNVCVRGGTLGRTYHKAKARTRELARATRERVSVAWIN